MKVTISRVPPQIKEEEIAQVIKDFAEPLRMNIIKDKYGIQTGSRHIIIKRSTMHHIPRFLKIGNVTLLVRYEVQPPCCEYCRTEDHEREDCKELEKKRQLWTQKDDRQIFEGQTQYPPPPQTDNTERQAQPMQEDIQPVPDVSSDKDFPLLVSAKSLEKTKNMKRTRDEVSPTEFQTPCCFKRLNRNRNAELCVCGETFFKCKCGLWKVETDVDENTRQLCQECDKKIFKYASPCNSAHGIGRGETLTCYICKTKYTEKGPCMSTQTI